MVTPLYQIFALVAMNIGLAIWPSCPVGSSISERVYSDIQDMNELHTSSRPCGAVPHHLLCLAPLLESPDGYKVGCDDDLQEQNEFVQPAE